MTALANEVNQSSSIVSESGRRINVVWAPQEGSQIKYLTCPCFEVLYHSNRGPGKMQPLESKIMTPMGWRKIGDLKVGSFVKTPKGYNVAVTHIYGHKKKDIYELIFDDGSKTQAGLDHFWKYKTLNCRRPQMPHDWHINDTKKIIDLIDRGFDVLIPTVDPLPMPSARRLKEYPIDPYLLGVWLGDGSHQWSNRVLRVGMTTADRQISEYIKKFGFKQTGDTIGYNLSKKNDHSKFFSGLSSLKLGGTKSHTKFIPGIYKFAPIEVRIAILQGLMDSDGYCSKTDSGAEYCSVSERLAKDVQEIVWSLGGKASINKNESYLYGVRHKDRYRVWIQPGRKFNPFRLNRKAQQVTGYMHKDLCRRVSSVKFIGKKDARCIRIDDPDHLYITDDYIVTHNTDSLLMDFAQHVGQGYGEDWIGVIFRRTYPELKYLINASRKWFPKIWPAAKYNIGTSTWRWPDGEQLTFKPFLNEEDYWNFHGQAYPFIGWDELCTWKNLIGYKRMFSCCRSTNPNVPRKIRATTNPYGPNHNHVKFHFGLPAKDGIIIAKNYIFEDPDTSEKRIETLHKVTIKGHLRENKILLRAQPTYEAQLRQSARNEAELKAWIEGSWDIVAGGMLDDVWSSKFHIVRPFPIPHTWNINRSFDWGSSAPFSVGWWARSDGSDINLPDGGVRNTLPGDLFRIQEWYGWNGKPNEGLKMLATEVAKGIVEREISWGFRTESFCRVKPGPADTNIFNAENGNCIALDMAAPIIINRKRYSGIDWLRADKRSGSRKHGWELLRTVLKNSIPPENGVREKAGLFVFDTAHQFIRTVPVLPRSDRDPDDVDTDTEDHIGDETRYQIRFQQLGVGSGKTIGHY